MSQLALSFGNHLEFVTANCVGCIKRDKQGCRDVDPMTCQRAVDRVKIQNEKGYKVVVGKFVVQPKKNLEEYLEFTDDELDIIRDTLGGMLLRAYKEFPELKGHTYDAFLPIINKIQARLLCPEFRDVKQFVKNVSNTWCEIIEEGGES